MTGTDPDERLLRVALDLARDAARQGGRPFGAVVASDGRILGRGTDVSDRSGDPTDHAELVAVRGALAVLGRDGLATCTLYASCEPCLMCTAAILRSGVSSICYAASRESASAAGYPDVAEAEIARTLGPAALTRRRLLPDEADAPFALARGSER